LLHCRTHSPACASNGQEETGSLLLLGGGRSKCLPLKCTHRGHGTESHGALAGHVGLVLLSELQARSPAVGHDVVHLLGNLVGGQGGQVGEGLELPACGCINVKKSDEGNGGRMGCKQALPRVIVKEAC